MPVAGLASPPTPRRADVRVRRNRGSARGCLYWAVPSVVALLGLRRHAGRTSFGTVPGVRVPPYLLFAAAIVLAAAIYLSPERRFPRMEKAILTFCCRCRSLNGRHQPESRRPVPVCEMGDRIAGRGGVNALVE
jgi:hypothetical protein